MTKEQFIYIYLIYFEKREVNDKTLRMGENSMKNEKTKLLLNFISW